MNRKNLARREIRIGLVPAVVFVGLVTGCMAIAFYLGQSSGRAIGFDRALAAKLANSVKMPIDEGALQRDVNDEMVSEIYAQLGKSANKVQKPKELSAAAPEKMPELGTIHTTDVAPVVLDDVAPEEAEEPAVKDQPAAADSSDHETIDEPAAVTDQPKNEPQVRVIGAAAAPEKPSEKVEQFAANTHQESLGSLVAEQKPEAPKTVVKPSAPEKSTAVAAAATKSSREIITMKQDQPATIVTQKAVKEPVRPPAQIEKPKASSSSGWFAQVAAPKDLADAQRVTQKLRSSGFAVQVENADVRGEKYYRVLVGPESSRAQAERLVAQLKRENYIKGDPFIKLMK